MFVRMRRQQALAVCGVAEGDRRLKFSVSENCSIFDDEKTPIKDMAP